jgi:hypothetical protein
MGCRKNEPKSSIRMKGIELIVIGISFLSLGCTRKSQAIKETWFEKPLSQWPSFALTNEISFEDTTYSDLANSFIVTTGYDTIGISCKHLFMVFEYQPGLSTIDLGNSFNYWKLYPKNDRGNSVLTKRLINKDSQESIGQFNTLKVRDWILFEIDKQNLDLYPLKIRYHPIKTREVVYAIGWGINQKDNGIPALTKLQCVDNLGDYYYMRTLSTNTQPHGRSGSPVIDKNGHLVGIVSGAEGNFAVIGSVSYLKKMFYKYGIAFKGLSP